MSLLPIKRNSKLVLSEDSPFRETILKALKPLNRDHELRGAKEKLTITIEHEYLGFKGPWIRLYQHKDMLKWLSPEACKILVYIALHMEFNQERIKIPQPDTGLSRRTYPRAVLELMAANIIRRYRKNEYWVNLTLLIIGDMPTPENTQTQ